MNRQHPPRIPRKLSTGMLHFLSPMNNILFRRATGVLTAAATQLLQPRAPLRPLCTSADPTGCSGVPSGALEALFRLVSLPEARAEAPPIPVHPLKKASDDAKEDAQSKELSRPVRYPAADRIIAVGDIHGDYGALRQVLNKAGVLGVDGSWSGGRTVLVQVGDQLDRGDSERKIYDMLFRLQDEAPNHGGAVHILLGNHEIMNSQFDFRYVTAGGFADFFRERSFLRSNPPAHVTAPVRNAVRAAIRALPPQMRARARALAPGGPLAAELAARAQVAVIVGDSVFVHAGLTPSHLSEHKRPVDALCALNDGTRDFLLGTVLQPPAILSGGSGPLWNRSYSRPRIRKDGPECQMLADTLRLLGARRMVVGHTVQRGGANSACGDKVWRIDTGMSSTYGGKPESIEIRRRGEVIVHTPRGVVSGKERSSNL